MFKKSQFVQYMVDVKGFSTEEATEIWKDIRGDVEEVLCREEIQEMADFSDVKIVFGEGNMTNYAII